MILSKLFRLRRGTSCGEILEVLQSYLDGETETRTARDVAVHLERCDHCEHESLIYRRIKISLSSTRRDIDPAVREALTRFGQRLARGDTP
jgi:anti-sigma factor RsiW